MQQLTEAEVECVSGGVIFVPPLVYSFGKGALAAASAIGLYEIVFE